MPNQALNRRDFLKTASAATLASLAAGFPRQLLAQTEPKIPATADTVIILWMAGGMAHTETFDPKRYTPYSAGLKPDQAFVRQRILYIAGRAVFRRHHAIGVKPGHVGSDAQFGRFAIAQDHALHQAGLEAIDAGKAIRRRGIQELQRGEQPLLEERVLEFRDKIVFG